MSPNLPPLVRWRRPATPRNVHRRAFALVAVLVLMALMLVLVLLTASLLQTERGATVLQLKQAAARQNALLGIRLGMGELQKALGPDVGVSARAEILEQTGGAPVQHPLWTEAWKPVVDSGMPEGVNPRARPQEVTWLVSGNSGDVVSHRPNPTGTNATPLVSLARHVVLSGTNYQDRQVQAP